MRKYKVNYEVQYDDNSGGHGDAGSVIVEAEDANSAKIAAEDEIMSEEAKYGAYISDMMIEEIIK